MARVDDWFEEFVGRLTERVWRSDWPPPRSEFWGGFRSRLVHHGVTEAVADAASVAMMDQPAPFLGDFVASFLAQVRVVWRSAEVTAPTRRGPDPADLERSAAWDRAARAHWRHQAEAARDAWRADALARHPALSRHPRVLELLACGLCFEAAPPSPETRPGGPAY